MKKKQLKMRLLKYCVSDAGITYLKILFSLQKNQTVAYYSAGQSSYR